MPLLGHWKKLLILLTMVSFSGVTFSSISAESVVIPEWLRNNVKWWAEGSIDDDSFVSGIEYLISDGIIDVPIAEKTVSSTDEIPLWVKTNANWWADGLISDSDFVKGIEFLVNSGIIQVKLPEQSQIDPPSLDIDAGSSDNIVDTNYEYLCSGTARCFTGKVTQIIDGDTIKVDGKSIRFALASASELDEPGGAEARDFIATTCSVGSIATVDEDDGQTQGSYGRILGVIYCNGFNLNQDLLDVGHGYLISDFCFDSEFANDDWAQKHGCSIVSEYLDNGCHIDYPYLWSDGDCYNVSEYLENGCPRTHPYPWDDDRCHTEPEPECPDTHPYMWSDGFCYTESEHLDNGCPRTHPYLWSDGRCYNLPEYVYEEPDCDPSYPDICIASYPPDLDCDEIPYANFRVIGSDPHGFDRDGDGIGCESGDTSSSSSGSSSSSSSSSSSTSEPDCDPSYPDVCIPPYPPDLDCGEIPYKNFRVVGDDPHRFDGDKDGIGCES